jgi:predicted DNA-binding transcriptional regulator AlpA
VKPSPALEPMLDYAGLAGFLNLGLRTVKRWVAEGTLPAPDLRRGRVVRWYPGTIRLWVERNRKGVVGS